MEGEVRSPTAARSNRPLPPRGAAIGGASARVWTVIEACDGDAVRAVDAAGVDVIVAFGDRVALEREANALRAMQDRLPVPRVIDAGDDRVFGPYLVLDERCSASGRDDAAEGGLGRLLAVLRAVEAAGYAWTPLAGDVRTSESGISVRRLRGASRLGAGARLDARTVIEAVGIDVVGDPLTVPPEVLRVILPSRFAHARTIEGIEREIAAAASRAAPAVAPADGVGACSDVGLVRERNEDAVRVDRTGDVAIAIVCDGISASARPEVASSVAADTALATLRARGGSIARDDMIDAIRLAHEAICAAQASLGGVTLGTTLVAAVVRGTRATVGWIGDSRAYFVGRHCARLLTRDHSWLVEALESGVVTFDDAIRSPWAHALTRCLGALEGSEAWHAEPEAIEVEVGEPGHLVLCSDGLWNYAPTAGELGELVRALRSSGCAATARGLVSTALARGGHDNASVAVVAVGDPDLRS